MVSLNYKNNVFKKLLCEEISKEDEENNIKKIADFKTTISNLPANFDFLIIEEQEALKIFYMVAQPKHSTYYPVKYRLYMNDGDRHNWIFYTFDVYSIDQIDGIIKTDVSEDTMCKVDGSKNIYDLKELLNGVDATGKKVFTSIKSRTEIENFLDKKINNLAQQIDQETKKKIQPQKVEKEVDKEVDKEEIDKIQEYTKKVENTEDTEPVDYNDDEIKDIFYNKSKIFTPSNLIGDAQYRSIQNVKDKVKHSLEAFDKKAIEVNPENLVPELITSAIIKDVISNPYKSVEIGPKLFSNDVQKYYKGSYTDTKISNSPSKNFLSNLGKGNEISMVKNLLLSDPNEIISAIALLEMGEIEWSMNQNGMSSKDEIMKVFGNEECFRNALICFPEESNEKLVDSYAMITNENKNRQLGMSTKGGANGKGASASIVSLFDFLFDDNTSIQFDKHGYNEEFSKGLIEASNKKGGLEKYIQTTIVPKLSKLGQEYWQNQSEALSYLIMFGGVRPANHESIINNMMKYGYQNTTFTKGSIRNFGKEVSARGITKLVMDLLDKQKYKFCQVNTKPTFVGNIFHWTYQVQYPARFSGEVLFEKGDRGLKFHIMGSIK